MTDRRSSVVQLAPKRRRTEPLPIQMTPELHEVIDLAARAIGDHEDVYARNGSIVHVVAASANDGFVPPEAPIIRVAHPATIREMLTKVARFEKYDGRAKKFVATLPPDSVVYGLANRGSWNGMRPLVGIAETPFLRPDGTVAQEPGYDAATGYVYVPSGQFPRIAESPTREDAIAAYATLHEPFAEFPFENEPLGHAVFIASVLSILARAAVLGAVPGVIISANTRGAGKTLAADAIVTIASGRAAGRTTFPNVPEEQEKVLSSFAMLGAPVIVFDNTSRIGGAALDKVMTATDRVVLRVLGKSEVASFPWRAFVMATGNNVEILGDTVRRVLRAPILSNLEHPENRTDARAQLLDWIRARRPELVAAALTILRAFVVAGRPGAESMMWGSFEEWSKLIPPAIMFAGGPNVLDAREALADTEDVEKSALRTLLDEWHRIDPNGAGLTAKEVVGRLYPMGKAPEAPDAYDAIREAIEALVPSGHGKPPASVKLGGFFRQAKKRVVNGKRFISAPGRAGVVRWKVEDLGGGVGGVGGLFSTTPRENADSSSVRAEKGQPIHPTQPGGELFGGAA